jgi:hypothetical protein
MENPTYNKEDLAKMRSLVTQMENQEALEELKNLVQDHYEERKKYVRDHYKKELSCLESRKSASLDLLTYDFMKALRARLSSEANDEKYSDNRYDLLMDELKMVYCHTYQVDDNSGFGSPFYTYSYLPTEKGKEFYNKFLSWRQK